jgi:hypothetical protein
LRASLERFSNRVFCALRTTLKRFQMALNFAPDCLPLPRSGAPQGRPDGLLARAVGPRGVASLAQRGPRDSALSLSAAGFPGLTFDADHERVAVSRTVVERQVDRLGMAYLRGERAVGSPPSEQLHAVIEQLRISEQLRPRVIKVEVMGPVSLALLMADEHERPLAYDPALRETLVQHVTLRATWLRDLIDSAGSVALICLDEPFLEALGSPFCPLDWAEGVDLLARVLDELRPPSGVCIAGSPDWAVLLALPVDLICFDAYEQSAGLVQAAPAVGSFLQQGGALGWGVVPAESGALAQERTETLAQRFASSVGFLAAASGVSAEQISRSALISTSGVLGALAPAQAEAATALCAEVSTAARAIFGLTS